MSSDHSFDDQKMLLFLESERELSKKNLLKYSSVYDSVSFRTWKCELEYRALKPVSSLN